ncbi:uncharacterized protein LY89DRAFT_689742 [Mollisia scopiformis]|uniref:RBR-type E3 ubiquitin transferase n=1 Tax=Mollisia scopiformis TaxID=149040 RepID=A0A132BDN3_MOLSC|nr:uncharacterized protein LY89DRAFT_689742 [Mollisia scopiformis]KUJ10530.1 hypothetical protein LY89DRAFT_689742 [Mollisia scopiformis]
MASNDGQRLLVLGLSYRQHHTLHMQQVLRAYDRLPANPMDRVVLYTALFDLAKDLDEDETRNIENWLKNGGAFPAPTPKVPEVGPGGAGTTGATDEVDHDDWPEYNPVDFETAQEVSNDAEMTEDEDEDEGEQEEVAEELYDIDDPTRQIDDPGEEFSDPSEDDIDDLDANFGPRLRRHAISGLPKKLSADAIECHICAESYELADFPPSTQITSSCDHKYNERTCVYCLQQTIAGAVSEGQLNRIVCPFCPAPLSREEVKRYATREIFSRYDYLVMRANPDLVMCLGLDCGSGQVHTGEDPMMICQACSFKTCAVHKLPWHEGQTCEEFDMDDSQIERLEEAEATAKLLATEQAQICPNCHQGVSRIDGCDHMTCRCGMEWCYQCGVTFENIKRLGESAHGASCMYNPRRVQMRSGQKQAVQGSLTALVHGGPVSDTLEKARGARNERIRTEMRPKVAEAAERRQREMEQQKKEERGGAPEKKRKLNLQPAWEEK